MANYAVFRVASILALFCAQSNSFKPTDQLEPILNADPRLAAFIASNPAFASSITANDLTIENDRAMHVPAETIESPPPSTYKVTGHIEVLGENDSSVEQTEAGRAVLERLMEKSKQIRDAAVANEKLRLTPKDGKAFSIGHSVEIPQKGSVSSNLELPTAKFSK